MTKLALIGLLWAIVLVEGTVTPGGGTSFDNDFSVVDMSTYSVTSNTWVHSGSVATSAAQGNAIESTDLAVGTGIVWMAFEVVDGEKFGGGGFASGADPSTASSVIFRDTQNTGIEHALRYCSAGLSCIDIASIPTELVNNTSGAVYAMRITPSPGEGVNNLYEIWSWSSDPGEMCNPATWGDADFELDADATTFVPSNALLHLSRTAVYSISRHCGGVQ